MEVLSARAQPAGCCGCLCSGPSRTEKLDGADPIRGLRRLSPFWGIAGHRRQGKDFPPDFNHLKAWPSRLLHRPALASSSGSTLPRSTSPWLPPKERNSPTAATPGSPPAPGPSKARPAPASTPSATASPPNPPCCPAKTPPSARPSSTPSMPSSSPPTPSKRSSSATSPTPSGACAASAAPRPACSGTASTPPPTPNADSPPPTPFPPAAATSPSRTGSAGRWTS